MRAAALDGYRMTATVAILPLYGWIASKVARRRIVPWVFGLVVASLLGFGLGLVLRPDNVWAGRAFYIWVSVVNLLLISLAWSVLVDVFASAEAGNLRTALVYRSRRCIAGFERGGPSRRVNARALGPVLVAHAAERVVRVNRDVAEQPFPAPALGFLRPALFVFELVGDVVPALREEVFAFFLKGGDDVGRAGQPLPVHQRDMDVAVSRLHVEVAVVAQAGVHGRPAPAFPLEHVEGRPIDALAETQIGIELLHDALDVSKAQVEAEMRADRLVIGHGGVTGCGSLAAASTGRAPDPAGVGRS